MVLQEDLYKVVGKRAPKVIVKNLCPYSVFPDFLSAKTKPGLSEIFNETRTFRVEYVIVSVG